MHAAARPGGGSEGSPKIALEAAGTTFLPRMEPPGGLSVFACLLRQPPCLAEEPLSGGEPRGGNRPRSFSHDEQASGRAEVPRRGVATDAVAGAGSRHEPVPAALAPPPSFTDAAAASPVEARACVTLEDLVPALVRKIAWSGDGSRGAVHLELGGEVLSGAKVLVCAEQGRVRVHLTAPAGTDLDAWRGRIARRLAGRGLEVDEIEVD